VELVPDAGGHAAMEQRSGRDVGDDDVVRGGFLERDAGVLGVDDAVLVPGMGRADRDVAELVVDVAARGEESSVGEDLFGDARVEPKGHHDQVYSVTERSPINAD